MKNRPNKRLKWYNVQVENKKVEQELKRKAKALSKYAQQNGIGYLTLTFFPGYISINAKKSADTEGYIVDTHAFEDDVNE